MIVFSFGKFYISVKLLIAVLSWNFYISVISRLHFNFAISLFCLLKENNSRIRHVTLVLMLNVVQMFKRNVQMFPRKGSSIISASVFVCLCWTQSLIKINIGITILHQTIIRIWEQKIVNLWQIAMFIDINQLTYKFHICLIKMQKV